MLIAAALALPGAALADAAADYAEHCASCHAETRMGGTGPARRLLGHRGVTEILGNHQAAPLAEQVTILDAALTAYRGEETRRDDMTLVAFRPRTLPRAT